MFLTILLLLLLICVCALKQLKRGNGERPPLAEGAWPIIGHTVMMLKNSEELYRILTKFGMDSLKQGGPVLVRIGTMDIYAISDPEDAYIVMKCSMQKDVVYDYFKLWIGEGLLTASEKIWKKHRKILNPTFNHVVLESYLLEFNKQARSLVINLDAKAGKGKFDHVPYMDHTTLQTICSTAMGVAIDENDIEMRERYINAKNEYEHGLIQRALTFWLHSEFIYGLSNLKKRQENHANTLRGLTNAFIAKYKVENSKKESNNEVRFKPFMEVLLDMERDGILTNREVQEEVDSFTLAGSDTITVTLAVVLLTIGSYPDIQRKILEELQEIFHGTDRDVEKQDLLQLKYLEAVIKETLRLFPTVPVIGRTLDKDVKIRNYTIPSGSRCYVSLYGVNRHSSWGSDVEQFRPERWLDPASVPNHLSLASFGLGKRRCIGSNFAMMSMKTTLAHVLRRYRVSGDVTQLALKIEVVGRLVSKNYISIERRTKKEYLRKE